jgi:RHS repeat-associated protein
VLTSAVRYDAWGRVESGAPPTFGFTGREWDAETGLYYYRARYYDPVIGRFLSEDPIDFDGAGLNFYAYVGGNPATLSDPLGLGGKSNSGTKIKSNVVYYICCKGGRAGVCNGPLAPASGATDWASDCMKAHEKQHCDEINGGQYPTQASFCTDPANEGKAIPAGSDKCPLECSAYSKEQTCLAPSPSQTQSMKDRKKFVDDKKKDYCAPGCTPH